jgi:phosphoserine phosphatase
MSDPTSEFIESVLALQPGIAVFDCDGTLWSGDSGRDFFYWEIERGLVSAEVADAMRARYRLYEAGEVGEAPMCGEMVTMHCGLSVDALHRAAEEFFLEVVSHRVFPEMQEIGRAHV